jgi:hypothetical protein
MRVVLRRRAASEKLYRIRIRSQAPNASPSRRGKGKPTGGDRQRSASAASLPNAAVRRSVAGARRFPAVARHGFSGPMKTPPQESSAIGRSLQGSADQVQLSSSQALRHLRETQSIQAICSLRRLVYAARMFSSGQDEPPNRHELHGYRWRYPAFVRTRALHPHRRAKQIPLRTRTDRSHQRPSFSKCY